MKINYLIMMFGILIPTSSIYAQTSPLDISKGLTVKQVNEALSSKIDMSKINESGGVAGLNDKIQITAPSASGGDRLGDWQKTAGSIDRYSIGFESNLMGGIDPYADGGQIGSKAKSLLLTTDPYGPYSPGCGLGVSMMGIQSWTPQFPVSQYNPALGAEAVVGVGGYDVVANCTLVGNQSARLILPVDHYTANSVELSRKLTAEEAAMIQWNMYITTNSPDTSIAASTTPTKNLPAKNLMAGYVILPPAAGDKSIKVWAWSVPGMGSYNANQVPQTTTLDTTWSAYTTPVVFLGGGAADHSFAHNWFFHINKDDLKPTATTKSLIHTVTPLEIDLSFYSPTGDNSTPPDHSLKYGGITFNAGEYPNALTDDSFEMMFGGIMHNHIVFDGGPDDWNISGDNFYTAAGLRTGIQFNHNTQLAAEWDFPIYGDTLRFMLWGENAGGTVSGYSQGDIHLGLSAYQGGQTEPVQSGDLFSKVGINPVRLGDIQFGYGARVGSVSLCGSGVNCGLTVFSDGSSAAGDMKPNSILASYNGYLGIDGNSSYNTHGVLIKNSHEYGGAGLVFTDATDTTGNTKADISAKSANFDGDVGSGGNLSGTGLILKSLPTIEFRSDANGDNQKLFLKMANGGLLQMTGDTSKGSPAWSSLEIGALTTHSGGTINGGLNIVGDEQIQMGHGIIFKIDGQTDYSNMAIFKPCADSGICLEGTFRYNSGLNSREDLKLSGAIASRGGAYNNLSIWSYMIGDGQGGWSIQTTTDVNDTTHKVIGGHLNVAGYNLSSLPTNLSDGAMLYCNNCKSNSVTGVMALWHSNGSKWTDMSNNNLSN